MGIDNHLKVIKEGVFGRDVRQAIHDGIQQAYDDATANGNANMEVAKARGTAVTLGDRLQTMDGKISQTTTDITRTEARIDDLIANAGNGTVPSELTDMRIGYDGTGFKTAGEAMRTQFLELNNDLDTAAENIGLVRPNLLNVEGQNRTNNGITWTFNLDGTVIVNGTATYNEYNKTTITLSAGEYYVSGAPLGSQTNTYHIMYTNGPSGASDVFFEIGNGSTLILSKDTSIDFYIRIMNKTTVNNVVFKPMIAKKAYGRLPYLPYKKLFQISPPTSSNWSGAVANFIGDSITHGAYGNYVDGVKTRLGLSVARNYGIGGCLMASSSEDQRYRPVVNRWNEMEEADIIFVFAGTNDYSHQVPIGDATSTDITTFNGALNTIMDGLRNKYPDKLVIFSSILHRYNDNSLPIKVDSYREAIRERCEAKQFIFYDIYRNSGFDFVRGYYDKVLTTDGLHPNKKGAEILSRKIAAFINCQ
ncbi:TPA: SGNH/GDSL hydrolase family protein [Streptococcus suis]|nr:SGNH/GDSL hydrolase family protein [Streptococcus suis]HEM5230810.1 SGNH/GDSL hydrolase family protein [Streptococcus suis]